MKWVPWRREDFTQAERTAAWQAYAELATRSATVPLQPGDGSMRAVMTSLHQLMGELRTIVRTAGPGCSPPDQFDTAANIIMGAMEEIRPFLTRWHPTLLTWEQTERKPGDLDDAWPDNNLCREHLDQLQQTLRPIARRLADIADVATGPHLGPARSTVSPDT